MRDENKEYSLVVFALCIFAISIILNIGFITKHIIINRECDCNCQAIEE